MSVLLGSFGSDNFVYKSCTHSHTIATDRTSGAHTFNETPALTHAGECAKHKIYIDRTRLIAAHSGVLRWAAESSERPTHSQTHYIHIYLFILFSSLCLCVSVSQFIRQSVWCVWYADAITFGFGRIVSRGSTSLYIDVRTHDTHTDQIRSEHTMFRPPEC